MSFIVTSEGISTCRKCLYPTIREIGLRVKTTGEWGKMYRHETSQAKYLQ